MTADAPAGTSPGEPRLDPAVPAVPDVGEEEVGPTEVVSSDPREAVEEAVGAGPTEPTAFVPVEFADVTVTLPSAYPTLTLEEVDPPRRRIAIPIGMAEGVAIAHAARDIATPRPLTHELFIAALMAYRTTVEALRITSVQNNSFSAELVLSGPGGQRTLGCRVSDGVALCLRQRPPAPITVAPGVIDQVGSAISSTT